MKSRNLKGQFIKGYPHNKGIKRKQSTIDKWRESKKKYKTSKETKHKLSLANKKVIRTPEWNKNVSNAKIGSKNPMFGKKLSEEHRRKISESHKGDKSYLWKGGISKENKNERNFNSTTFEYKNWRRKVFERDYYTCIWCGYKGDKIHADHIKEYKKYPELRLNVDNGRTLCIPCHKLRHKTK